MKYPLPSYAASIHLSGDTVWLGLPSFNGEDRGHSVPVPATLEGMAQVLRILQSRERDFARQGRTGGVGTDSSPTRGQIEAAIARREHFRKEREAKLEREPKRKREPIAEINLEELGL